MQNASCQRSSTNSLSNATLRTRPLLKRSLFSRCAELSVGHGKVNMSVQDFSGLRLHHSRAVQSTVTVNIAAFALIKATEIWKISPCSTFLLPWLWKKDYRGNSWKHWAWSSCFWGCFSPASSVDVAATCYRWRSVPLWRNGHLRARCSI